MNNASSTSEYISGCESGWTMYLDHNSNSTDPYTRSPTFYQDKPAYSSYTIHQNHYQDEDEDEDLSMVSDASSGPPHYHNSQYYAYASEDKSKTKSKSRTRKEEAKQQSLCLDDTASSSIFHFSPGNAPPSDDHKSVENVYSALHFEDESIKKKRLSFFHSSTKGKSGRKRQ